MTAALRGSDNPPWPATRELIADKGIDVQDAAVVDLIPTRHNIGYLVSLVKPGMRVFTFYLGIVGDPAEPKMWSDLAYIVGVENATRLIRDGQRCASMERTGT